MIWIYGGSLAFGSSSIPFYDGSSFAAYENVIMVSFNYRLNSANTLHHTTKAVPRQAVSRNTDNSFLYCSIRLPSIAGSPIEPDESELSGSEIRSAMGARKHRFLRRRPRQGHDLQRVIRRYICRFDPDSSSCLSVAMPCCHRSEREYHQSKPGSLGVNTTQGWLALVSALDCSGSSPSADDTNSLECVRRSPAHTIKNIIQDRSLSFPPVVDSVTFVSSATRSRSSGRAAKVPLLVGSTANGGTLFIYGQDNLTPFVETTFAFLPQLQPLVAQAYRVGRTGITTSLKPLLKYSLRSASNVH